MTRFIDTCRAQGYSPATVCGYLKIQRVSFPALLDKKIDEITAADVQKSLSFLTRAGLLKRAGKDAFMQAETSIVGTPDATRLALRGMHGQMSRLAAPAVNLPVDERHFSGVTMGLSRRSYERIASLIDEFRRQVIAVAAEDKDIEQVYRLNLQLFPLSKNVKECKNEEV